MEELLIKKAIDAMEKSYSPYSDYPVGAAVLAENDEIYSGCNIENVSFGATICAERTAIFKAISEGKRNFKRIVIVGGFDKVKEFCTPCILAECVGR